MPTRMIREGLLDSERYASISNDGRLFFHHLMLLADDFGCVSLSPAFLRRRCFYDAPTNERISRLICELADADLIRTYEADRHVLAFIPRFRQRLYRATLKHSIPPEQLYSDDDDALTKFNEIKNKTIKTPGLVRGYHGVSTGLPPPEVEVKLNRREEKAKPVDNSTRSKQAWWETESGMLAKGMELGTQPRPGEGWPQFKDRLFQSLKSKANT